MSKKGDFWVWFLTIPLLAFSAYRNLDLILTTMNGDPGSIVAGIGALAALDLGVLFWLMAFNHARANQRTISGVMIVVDLLGAIAGMLADTLLRSDAGSLAYVRLVASWVIPVVIGLNFAAGILYHMADPDRAIADAERAIDEQLHKHLADAMKANAKQTAAAAVPDVLANRMAEAVAAFQSQGVKRTDDHKSIVDALAVLMGRNGKGDKSDHVILESGGAEVSEDGEAPKGRKRR